MKIKEGILLPSIVHSLVFNNKLGLQFSYKNIEYNYTTSEYVTHLCHDGGDNAIILRKVYGLNYTQEVNKLYGRRSEGNWPVWYHNDEIIRLLLDMESKGVIITIR